MSNEGDPTKVPEITLTKEQFARIQAFVIAIEKLRERGDEAARIDSEVQLRYQDFVAERQRQTSEGIQGAAFNAFAAGAALGAAESHDLRRSILNDMAQNKTLSDQEFIVLNAILDNLIRLVQAGVDSQSARFNDQFGSQLEGAKQKARELSGSDKRSLLVLTVLSMGWALGIPGKDLAAREISSNFIQQ